MFLNQLNISDEKNEFTVLISKNDSKTYNWLNTKYSDNESFVISQQEFTEYSLSSVDNIFFHYGLFDKNYNFMGNAISYDSFNLLLLKNNILFNYNKSIVIIKYFKFILKPI